MPLIDPPLADSIRGDLEEERRRRAQQSPAAARMWFWRTWLGIRLSAALTRAWEAGSNFGRSNWLGPAHEWRQALRGLRRTPWYTASGIGVIALSLRLTTTVFAVVDGVVFRPLPYARPDRIAFIRGGFRALPKTTLTQASLPDVRAWKAAAPTAEFMTMRIGELTPFAEADPLHSASVDAGFFHFLGVEPLIGGFTAADFGGPPNARIVPAILAYATWQARFGGDPSVIGQVRTDNAGQGLRVVGVLPPSFIFPQPIASFIPEAVTPLVPGRWGSDPTSRSVEVLVRMPDDLSFEALAARLTAATPVVARAFPPLADDPRISAVRRVTRGPFDIVHAKPLMDELTTTTGPVSVAVFATAAGLLVLAALNLIGLSASRFIERQSELGLRRALGGTTIAIIRLVAIEHALLILAGGALGLALSPMAIDTTARVLPKGVVLFKAVTLDLRVVTFSVIALAVTLAIVTAGIAVAAPRRLVQSQTRATEPARGTGRSLIVAMQVALALVMTVAGSLLASSLIRIWTAPNGLKPEHAARLRVRSPTALDLAAFEAFLGGLRQIPGVMSAGAEDLPFLERAIYGSAFEEPVGAGKMDADTQSLGITSDFFAATGLDLVSGRFPTRDEFTNGASVAIVSSRLAELYWHSRPAVGEVLRRSRDGRIFTVVGVVPDIRTVSLEHESGGEIYTPLSASPQPNVANILVRFQPGHDDALGDVIAASTSNRAGLHVLSASTLATALGESIDWRRFQAWLFVTLGAAALAIVGVGILGLMAMRTGRRTREVGVRMALGATRLHVRRQLVVEQFRPVATGLVVGSGCAIWATTAIRSYLYKPPAYDWTAWSAAVMLIIAASLMGVAIPAWRASRIDPSKALRTD
jgi:predicted permease